MKVEVIEIFQDRNGVHHQVGDVLDIKESERVHNLVEKNLVKVADDEEEKPSARRTATRTRSK